MSRILDECGEEQAEHVFADKEVLLKVITVSDTSSDAMTQQQKLKLIDDISNATNQQTTVIGADRISNDDVYIRIQTVRFERYGLLFERKRGEFGEGIKNGYIDAEQVIERNLLFRIYLASNGFVTRATEKKIFLKFAKPEQLLDNVDKLDTLYFGHRCFQALATRDSPTVGRGRLLFGKVYAMVQMFQPRDTSQLPGVAESSVELFHSKWDEFVDHESRVNTKYLRTFVDKDTRERRQAFSVEKWILSGDFQQAVHDHFRSTS